MEVDVSRVWMNFGVSVNGPDIIVHPGEIAQGLDAACRGTSTEGDEVLAIQNALP